MAAAAAAAAAAATAVTRLLHSTTTALCRHGHSSTSFIRLSPGLLRPLSFSTGPDTAPAVATEAAPLAWPEWEEFLEKLRTTGYFEKGIAEGDEGWGKGSGGEEYAKVKFACLGFAKERPDILRLLPRKDIQAVVECGCPNLLRKSVNSAKRLRDYVNLDEGNVCSSCNLRETCDRAYVLAKKDEGARTVDIMRVLFQYAAGQILPNSSACSRLKVSAEESARNLLSELIKLCDTQPDPELLKTMVTAKKSENLPQVPRVNEERQRQHVETKRQQNVEMKRGDWMCTQCNFLNYARNLRCLECKADGPKRVSLSSPEMKKGDWTCPQCQFMNFARNTQCKRCQESRPWKALEPGEWECPSCNFLNFRRNDSCLKCNCDRPREGSSGVEDNVWRRPKLASEASKFIG